MRTPFGIALRELRDQKSLKLHDVAAAVGVSSAFISALETGRKSIPDGFVTKLRRALHLTEKEAGTLRRARDRTSTEVSVTSLQGSDRELVAYFARQLGGGDVDADILSRLRKKMEN